MDEFVRGIPQDFGTSMQKWLLSHVLQLHDRLAVIESAAASGAPAAGGTEDAQQTKLTAKVAFPDWMRPHSQTKKKVVEKAAIMGFVPTKEQVLEKAEKLKTDVWYTKKQGAGIWNCSEKVALGWFFYMGHVLKLKFDKPRGAYMKLKE